MGFTEPLLHLVRSALAYAVEPAAARLERGREAALTISLRTAVESRKPVLAVEDDGLGLDTAALRRAAVKNGLRSSEDVAALSDTEALELMLLLGLSTAPKVDAGAGVGMDAARAGTTRVSDTLFVGAGGRTSALPLGAAELLIAATPEALASGQLLIEDAPIPLLRLTHLLGLSPTPSSVLDPAANVEA